MPVAPITTSPALNDRNGPPAAPAAVTGATADFFKGDTYAVIGASHQDVECRRLGQLPHPNAAKSAAQPSVVRPPAALGEDLRAHRSELLRQRLAALEQNEVLRNELQTRFINALADLVEVNAKAVEQCFDEAFAGFAVLRPQRHWVFLADVFKSSYVAEALHIFCATE